MSHDVQVRAPRRSAPWLALLVAGLVIVVGGAVYWGFANEYGSGLNFSTETGPGGETVVYELGEDGSERQVFEGTEDAAGAYMEERREAEENLLLPAVLIVVAAVAVAAGLLGWRRQRGRPA